MSSKKKLVVLKFPSLPCHSQSVKRHIKLVTEASSSEWDPQNRKGYIFNKTQIKNDYASLQFKIAVEVFGLILALGWMAWLE